MSINNMQRKVSNKSREEHTKLNHKQCIIPAFKKESVVQAFVKFILLSFVLFSSTSFAGLGGIKSIIVTSSKLNTSGWLQVSEIVATQTGTGKDLSHISEGATVSSSSSFSKESNARNIISGVAPDRYPKIFHSGKNDKTPTLKITLALESELDSITLYGRADCCENRDIYDIALVDSSGKIIFQKSDLSASNALHYVRIDLAGNLLTSINNTPTSVDSSKTHKENIPTNAAIEKTALLPSNAGKKSGDKVETNIEETTLVIKTETASPMSRQEEYNQRFIDREIWNKKYGQHARRGDAALRKGDKEEATRLFKELIASKPYNRGLLVMATNRLAVLAAEKEEMALEKFKAENGGMRPKEKIAFDKLMNPLISDVNSEFYKGLNFTVTEKKETSQTHGFFTRRVLWLNVNIRFNDVDTLIRQYGALDPAIKKHIKQELDSVIFTRALRVHASYSLLVGDKVLANTTATYDKIKWDITSNTGKEELSGKLAELNERIERKKLAELKANQLPPISGVIEISEKEILALMKPVHKRMKSLLSGWSAYQNQKLSSLPRREYQSDMVDYVRDEAPGLLSPIVDSALLRLTKIDKNNPAAYNHWDQKIAKPIRKLLDDGLLIWDYGFNVSVQNKVNSAYGGASEYADSELYSRITPLAKKLLDYQYAWVQNNRVGTIADPGQKLPQAFSASKGSFKYVKPIRIRARLETPREIMFEGLGEQAGKAGVAFMNYANQLKEFEKNIIKTRKAYFNCYPNCVDIKEYRKNLSKILIEKDLYFLQLSGQSGMLQDRAFRRMSAVVESFGAQGSSIIDGGIPNRCKGPFQNWEYKFSQSNNVSEGQQLEASIGALGKFAQGDVSALLKLGNDMKSTQDRAFMKSGDSYRKYQLCRDQWEFDSWELKHGELKRISY